MDNIINAITLNTRVSDVHGNILPPGNYFFLILNIDCENIKGIVKSERITDFNAIYEFTILDYISMISKANIRLSILANIDIPCREDFYISDNENNIEEQENETCSICLTPLLENREILSCAHHFHYNCISRWLIQNNSCPICRHPVNYFNNENINNDENINTENVIIEDNDNLINIINRRRRRRRRRATTPPRNRRRTRNTIITPVPPRRSERLALREREYNQMFSSINIMNLFQE